MRLNVRRSSLEAAVRALLVATIVAVSFGSSGSPAVRSVAQPLWRVALVVLCFLSLAYAKVSAAERGTREVRSGRRSYALAAALLAVAVASAGWSVEPRTTLARAASFGLLLVTAAALSYAVVGEREAGERLLLSVLAGATAVALLGLAVLVVAPSHAIQEATRSIPTRYRGIAQNPNTVAMLFAVVLPVAAWFAGAARGRIRLVAGAALVLLAGSIVGSGSRAALVTGAAGVLVVVLANVSRVRHRLLAALGLAALTVGAVALTQLPKPIPASEARPSPAIEITTGSPHDAEGFFRLQDEIDRPGTSDVGRHRRRLLGSSGRGQAWTGAVEQGADRPLLGYGFGTEHDVFVDRYYSFYGGVPEDSYIGMFLQLGGIGLALLVGLVLALLGAALRGLRRIEVRSRTALAACAGSLVVGLGLAVAQSYLYSVGNNATLSIWICAFLGLALATPEPVRA